MTQKQLFRCARWIYNNGITERRNIPRRFKDLPCGDYGTFAVMCTVWDKDGYPQFSDGDIFSMTDSHKNAYLKERLTKIISFRDWIEPVTSAIAILLSIAALVISIIALRQ